MSSPGIPWAPSWIWGPLTFLEGTGSPREEGASLFGQEPPNRFHRCCSSGRFLWTGAAGDSDMPLKCYNFLIFRLYKVNRGRGHFSSTPIPNTPWDYHRTADQLGWLTGGAVWGGSPMAVPWVVFGYSLGFQQPLV